MFNIHTNSTKEFELVILSDESSGTRVEVLPACGGILNSFSVIMQGEDFNVIMGYNSSLDFKENVESKGFRGCKLSPFVCRVNQGSYRFGESNYKLNKYYLGNNALHGLIYDQVFNVLHLNADEEKADVTMKYEYRGTDTGYPFNYDCIVTYSLEKDNKLNVITEIVNIDEGLIPVQDGWHPYFTLHDTIDSLQLELQSKEILVFDNKLIPTGELENYNLFTSLKDVETTSFDNCFTVNFAECQPMCVLRNPLKKIEVEVYPDVSYPYLQLYTPPDRQSIAIENLSSAPDAFNNNLGGHVLSPGETCLYKTSYKIKLLS